MVKSGSLGRGQSSTESRSSKSNDHNLATGANYPLGISSLLQRHDVEELRNLLPRYRPMLLEMAQAAGQAHLRAKVDASDIVQEALCDAVQAIGSLRAERTEQFIAWLRALLDNQVHNAHRRYVVARKRSVFRERTTPKSLELADRHKAGDEELLAAERLGLMREAVRGLPESLQLLLQWRFDNELSYSEIARRLNRSEDAVRMLIKRCLVRLHPEVFGDGSTV